MRLAMTTLLILLVASVAMADKIPFRTCDPCVGIAGEIFPTLDWQILSGEYLGDDNSAFQFCAVAGETYTFSFCQGGGTADYDTALSIQGPDACGEYLECNDDTCGLLSEVVFVAPADGNYIVSIDAYSANMGLYDMAYMGMPCTTATAEETWGTLKSLY